MTGKRQNFLDCLRPILSRHRGESFFAALLLTVCAVFLPYCISEALKSLPVGDVVPLEQKSAPLRDQVASAGEEMPLPVLRTEPVRVVPVCSREKENPGNGALRKLRNVLFVFSLEWELEAARPVYPVSIAESFHFQVFTGDSLTVRAGPCC